MKARKNNLIKEAGFSLVELMLAMTIMLVVLGLAGSLLSKAYGARQWESSRTDGLTSAQAALSIMSREIANAGYGLTNNGIIAVDSDNQRLHFVSNTGNNNAVLTDPYENVMFYFDPTTSSILRYDANGNGVNSPQTSTVINSVSQVNFLYFDNSGANSVTTSSTTPTNNTGRVRVSITISLQNVQGQPLNQSVVLVSDVTLRNSKYMLENY